LLVVFPVEGPCDAECRGSLVLLAGEVVSRFYDAGHAAVEVAPAGVVGVEDCEGEARGEGEGEVDLAVFAGGVGGGVAADAGGELFVEILGLLVGVEGMTVEGIGCAEHVPMKAGLGLL
jgi:hypothetical protein